MADDNDAGDIGGLDEGTEPAKKGGGLKGAFPQLLKWILIGLAAVIFIVTVVVVTVKIVGGNGKGQTENFTVGSIYTTKREIYDWYTSLDQIRTNTDEEIPASVVVQVALGYKKDDKAASTEITSRRIEITDFLRRFFSEQTSNDLKPQNEEILRQNIRDQINDEILSDTSIKDVRFTTLDVVQQ
ncbi:MAG TPA: flagellar basal body protein FliL [Treponema sp.]|nr:flagellar basal body-associated FliL family protein [Treponema sp.]HAK69661.1 flagellar basal body protein FliL [Treponema sp.]HBB42578.1 flagellar basal body protein FliL [Treponema sp.]HCA19205.1 flagellar basal body protein FliL [Treponema sp.]